MEIYVKNVFVFVDRMLRNQVLLVELTRESSGTFLLDFIGNYIFCFYL